MSTSVSNRNHVQWVPIEQIVPNPLNPRKNDAIKTEEMQDIILSKGWEIPLTVYQKGKNFIVLSGHRRLYAAKQTKKVKEIPVYIVETPENHQEEIERIASLQRGQVDWSPYEWGKFTYERWIAWGKPTYREFAKRLNLPERTVAEYIEVLHYYPRHEIEIGLENKTHNMSTLDALIRFMSKMKVEKMTVVANMTEEMVRKVMLKKIENKLITRETLRRATAELFDEITDEDLIEFITTSNMPLQTVLDNYGIDMKPTKTFHGRLVSIGIAKRTIKDANIPYEEADKEKLLQSLQSLETILKSKIRDVKKSIKKPIID